MESFNIPRTWWGGHGWGGRPPEMSVLELVQAGSIDLHLAALLWLMMEKRASVVVAAGPIQGAGKTTTLTALMGLLPSDVQTVFTKGWQQGWYGTPEETFEFTQGTPPDQTFVLVNEISDHLPTYLWGSKVGRLFELLEQGYAMGATMHADTVEEVLEILESSPLGISRSRIASGLKLIMMLEVLRLNGRTQRRIVSVHFLLPSPAAPGGLGMKSLTAWKPDTDSFTHFSSPETRRDLAGWLGMGEDGLAEKWEQRERFLAGLLDRGITDFEGVREAVLAYLKSAAP